LVKHPIVIILLFWCGGAVQSAEKPAIAIVLELNLLGVGLGATYGCTDRLQLQMTLGVSSNYMETQWNDLFIQAKTHYAVFKPS
jgi:hypothetical protein